jgi:hypothetical protein
MTPVDRQRETKGGGDGSIASMKTNADIVGLEVEMKQERSEITKKSIFLI